ncbi:MAG: DMT family transporter [Woeseia sp.]
MTGGPALFTWFIFVGPICPGGIPEHCRIGAAAATAAAYGDPLDHAAGTIPAWSWLSAATLGVLCTGIAFVMYYRLVARIGANRTSTVTYLIPVFGVGWAWWLLDEPVTWSMAVAGAIILGSVALSQRGDSR